MLHGDILSNSVRNYSSLYLTSSSIDINETVCMHFNYCVTILIILFNFIGSRLCSWTSLEAKPQISIIDSRSRVHHLYSYAFSLKYVPAESCILSAFSLVTSLVARVKVTLPIISFSDSVT